VIRGFSCRYDAIMAARTGANDLGVVYCNRRNGYPRGWIFGMTRVTDIRAIDMVWPFASGTDSVMTVNTVAHKTRMIYYCTCPL
jgi:hypothetical protein